MRLSEVLCQVSQGQEAPQRCLYYRPSWRKSSNILGKTRKRNWVMIKNGQPILIKEGKSSIKQVGILTGCGLAADDWKQVSILEAMGVNL